MAPDYNTIDDIPLSSHNQYAEAQSSREEAQRIQQNIQAYGSAQADVLTSSYVSAVKAIVGLDQTNIPIATFAAPAIFSKKSTNLFKDEVVPSLGNNERLQLVKERLESLPRTLHGG